MLNRVRSKSQVPAEIMSLITSRVSGFASSGSCAQAVFRLSVFMIGSGIIIRICLAIFAAAVKVVRNDLKVVAHRQSGDLLRLCAGQFYVDTLLLELI